MPFSPQQKSELLRRYRGQAIANLTYGTVRDYCDSADHIPFLSYLQGDLKDLQRPAAFKTILGLLPPGSRLLEIGAGEPSVAHALDELGYIVTIVDPYDGSGNGPTEFENYVEKYPRLQIIRTVFDKDVRGLAPGTFDCIYSISVLEHVHQPALSSLFGGIRHFLKQDGYSLHLIDHVLAGEGQEFHFRQLAEILTLQSDLAFETNSRVGPDLNAVIEHLTDDVDTYYLSAEGHNKWRGATPYVSCPFRKVVSVHSYKQLTKQSP